jgi:hypothetical protein
MNLQPITPRKPSIRVPCYKCGKWEDSGTGFADLDGEPFQTFYCKACADELTKEQK